MNDAETPAARGFIALLAEFRRLLQPCFAAERRALFFTWMLALAAAGAAFAGPMFLADLLDLALPRQDRRALEEYGAALLACLVLYYAFTSLKSFLLAKASERMFLALRSHLVAALVRQPAAFFARHEAGDLLTRVSGDTEQLALLFFDYLFWSLTGCTTILLYAVFMLVWNWRLGLATMITLPLFAVVLHAFQRPIARAAARARQSLSRQNATFLDLVNGIPEIRFHQQAGAANRRFLAAAETYTLANIRSVRVGEWGYNTAQFLTEVVIACPFLLGGWLICRGETTLSIGLLVAYNFYLSQIMSTLQVMMVGFTRLSQTEPILRRLGEILEAPAEARQPSGEAASLSTTRLELRAVSFAYLPDAPVLRDFSLIVEPGEKVALMGPSGTGKSTLINLLTRQLRPDSGAILLGGRPIEEYGLPYYLQHFAYVRQRPFLFEISVRENLALGWYDPPFDLIVEATRRVGMHECVERLPRGYETVVGEAGVEFSEGQKQRLTLARALIREPAILLLDEFTSALDQKTEREILDMVLRLFPSQTVICATHSPAVARSFTRVVTLEKL